MTEKKLFKDWFDHSAAELLAEQMRIPFPKFPRKKFIQSATHQIESKEFLDRVKQFSSALNQSLPQHIPDALRIIRESFPPALETCESISGGWLQWPIGQYIADYGVPYYDDSMLTMVELTQRFSAEFAIRPFIDLAPEKTLARLMDLTRHPNPHVRRWCSEGIRPRLPWGKRLDQFIINPAPILPILERLTDDQELYVRKSVANNLNDISKDHPDIAIGFCRRLSESRSLHAPWIQKHALRSLIKSGHPLALKSMGYDLPRDLQVDLRVSPRRINVGEGIRIEARIQNSSRRSVPVMIDYVIGFVRQNNRVGRKVFKGSTLSLPAGESYTFLKIHPVQITTVRRLYPGKHTVEIQINGAPLAQADFMLDAAV